MSHIDATSAQQIDDFLAKNGGVALIDFHAKWCGPCINIAPKLKEFSEKYGVGYIKIDVDEAPELSAAYNIRAMPTFNLVQGPPSKVIKELVGANPSKVEELFQMAKTLQK